MIPKVGTSGTCRSSLRLMAHCPSTCNRTSNLHGTVVTRQQQSLCQTITNGLKCKARTLSNSIVATLVSFLPRRNRNSPSIESATSPNNHTTNLVTIQHVVAATSLTRLTTQKRQERFPCNPETPVHQRPRSPRHRRRHPPHRPTKAQAP